VAGFSWLSSFPSFLPVALGLPWPISSSRTTPPNKPCAIDSTFKSKRDLVVVVVVPGTVGSVLHPPHLRIRYAVTSFCCRPRKQRVRSNHHQPIAFFVTTTHHSPPVIFTGHARLCKEHSKRSTPTRTMIRYCIHCFPASSIHALPHHFVWKRLVYLLVKSQWRRRRREGWQRRHVLHTGGTAVWWNV